ncbi:MAG: cob(I)yrinic acid a,c-diamide adenosyltransferase [Halothiobacillus sp.]|nr:cob(I)yrinic acid a,c-diamide adenosyltransferase [Halothiobacillus sp.]
MSDSTDSKNRLSRIVTQTGDGGMTGMADGARLPKTHPRVVALGDLDELNAHIGLLRSYMKPVDDTRLDSFLEVQQHALFDLGGFIAMASLADSSMLPDLDALEQWVEQSNAGLPPLKEFILPGGSVTLAQAHIARVTARRAERNLWALVVEDASTEPVAVYLNRLSDALFILARILGEADGSVVYWRKASR